MPYRRPPQNTKRYHPPLLPFNIGPRRPAATYTAQSGHKDYLDIPMPNEQEYPSEYVEERRGISGLSGIVEFVRTHIHVEELILIGLIILVLDESLEDNLLLILLIYILLF